MTKKIITLIVAITLSLLIFCGCDNENDTTVTSIIVGGKIYPIVIVGE